MAGSIMRQKLFVFLTLIGLVVILIGLNAATYVQKQKVADTEFVPNRSTYNPGSTGTQALYSLLSETGRKVVRWQEPPDALRTARKNKPNVFVVIGSLKRQFTEVEAADLYQWVSEGGRLVIIDREPHEELLKNTTNWKVHFLPANDERLYDVDPADQNQITKDVPAAKPVQPTAFISQVNAVQPSRFASSLGFERTDTARADQPGGSASGPPPPPPPKKAVENKSAPSANTVKSTPPPAAGPANRTEKYTIKGLAREEEEFEDDPADSQLAVPAAGPVVHLEGGDKKAYLVDIPYGSGKIVYLSDPYIVSNAGINLVDNSQLALNIVSSPNGIIAFDEYHHGFGTNNNRLFQYFAGTPVIAIFAQLAILAGFVFFSQSRRFGRPVPEPEPDRLSKLEYVSAMAELQERTRAFDLAIENIYTDFRRRTARLLGVDNYTVTRKDMARMIAERIKLDPNDVEDVMFQCEDIMHGEPTNKKEVLTLMGRLRVIEDKLGLKRTGRSRI
jgi:hypothetical protein